MAKKEDKKLNEKDRSYKGCYGQHVSYQMLPKFLESCFSLNAKHEAENIGRFAACIWGHAGCGKTEIAKQFANRPVTWNGREYKGWDVRDVPIAQFEEMGDLHGLPSEAFLVRNENNDEQWAIKEALPTWLGNGYKIVPGVQSRTMYAPPDWVPLTPGPAILLLDDWNRASIRIIKGIMQLLQNYGMVSWKLPAGCNIVLTGNPDEQDYLVTTIDAAILTRIKHVTLKEDAKEWAVWATKNELDHRGISWVLYQPEMMIGPERTNPRTLSEYFRALKEFPNITEANQDEVRMHAASLLDDETVASFLTFLHRDMEDVIEPEEILDGKKDVPTRMKKLMDRKEPRTDILGIVTERLYATMLKQSCKQSPERIAAFQEFITMPSVPDDMRHSVCRRLSKADDAGRSVKWLMGNEVLRKQILSLLRDR
jgi:hypothetical protein